MYTILLWVSTGDNWSSVLGYLWYSIAPEFHKLVMGIFIAVQPENNTANVAPVQIFVHPMPCRFRNYTISGSVYWCIDYRNLNDYSIEDAYIHCKKCPECLGVVLFLSILDLQLGYWQNEMAEKDTFKMAFNAKDSLLEYAKMPFGLDSASNTSYHCVEPPFQGH